MSRVRLPELGRFDRSQLWLRYQRYGLLLLGLPVAVLAIAAAATPWWLTVVVALAAIAPVRFGFIVLARWPRKLRATRVALARIEAGTFTAASIKSHCGDPCFRVVANEILARAGTERGERRQIIQSFKEELRNERDILIVIDHVRGTILTFGGDAQAQERK